MKQLIFLVVVLVLSMSFSVVASRCDAGEYNTRINVSPCVDRDDCLVIRTAGGPVYRVYGCGKLEKKDWKELNPNEETLVFDTESGDLTTQGVFYIQE